jgi:pimeloyl-ACP methyl ester carboxylesterase
VVPIAGIATLEALRRREDGRRFPAPGRLVDVGGYRLHLTVAGNADPTVVLVQGLSGIGLGWGEVAKLIAPFGRVVTYDRAGAGWSDAHRGKRTCLDMARELHELLACAELAPPYVLAGQSLGGHIVRLFAAEYPDDVVGLVLVDPTDDAAAADRMVRNNIAAIMHGNVVAFTEALLTNRTVPSLLVRLGLVRALVALRWPPMFAEILSTMPEDMRREFVFIISRPDYVDAFTDEIAGLPESQEQTRASRERMPDVPIAVLIAAVRGVIERAKWDSHRASAEAIRAYGDGLASLTPSGRLIVLDDSDHLVSLRRPDAVAEAVQWVMASGADARAVG